MSEVLKRIDSIQLILAFLKGFNKLQQNKIMHAVKPCYMFITDVMIL